MSEPTPERPANLGQRFLRGSLYVGIGNWFTYALNLVIQIAIARLLGPGEIGFYAFVFAINEFLNIVGALSLSIALIQSREESQELYDTALAICALLGLIGLVAAGCVAPFLWELRSPRAAWFLLVMAIGRALFLLSQVPMARLERQIRYGRVGLITVLTGNLPNLAAVGFALAGFGAWSLVLRDVGATVLALLLATGWSGYRFRGAVRREPGRRLMAYARPMFVSRSLEITMDRVDRLMVGGLLGDVAIGLYHQARYLAETGNVAMRPVMQLSLNLYARLQDQPERLARSFGLVNFFVARLTFAGGAVLLIFPQETVRLLLGEEWASVGPLLRWLGLYGALYPLFENLKALFYAVDRVKGMVRIRVLQLACLAPAVLAACLGQELAAVAAALLAVTGLGMALALRSARAILGAVPHVMRAPLVILAVTVALFLGLGELGLLGSVPWALRPFLPPLVYGVVLGLVERSTLLRELGYLARQLRGGEPPAESAATASGNR